MDAPANTLNYMIAGFVVFFSITAIYLVSLVLRWRAVRRDLELLESLEKNPTKG